MSTFPVMVSIIIIIGCFFILREVYKREARRRQVFLRKVSELAAHSYRNSLGEVLPLNLMASNIFAANKAVGWWPENVEHRNKGELIALMHSELSEALEGLRKDRMDDHLPHRKMVEVELADTIIRILDFAGAFGLDLDGAVSEKLAYNKKRSDHKKENREKENGKKF